MLFPNRCVHCTRIIRTNALVCNACWHQLSFSHREFDGANDFAKRCRVHFPVENAFSLFEYTKSSSVQLMIHQLKYKHRENVGKILANLLIERMKQLPSGIDVLTYIPLHRKKMNERGFNQLTKFCTILGNHYGIPVAHDILLRTKYKKAQAKSTKQERNNTQGLFECVRSYNDTHFLLIDDVFTTGNTISSAAWELLKSGKNNKISILVMAEDR